MAASLRTLLLFAAATVALAACTPERADVASAPDGWYEFQGSWNAAGRRQVLGLGAGRRAAVTTLSGTMLLAGPGRPGVGFRGEAIVLYDTTTGLVGRAAWTDENGDQVYSEVQGQDPAKGHRLTGTFIGGTGRYAGATGGYSFTWQYTVDDEDGTVQGRAVDVTGRLHVDARPPSPAGSRP